MRLLMARIVVAGVGAVSFMHIPEGVFWVELTQEDGLFVGLPLCVCVCLHRKLPTGISVKFEIWGCLLDLRIYVVSWMPLYGMCLFSAGWGLSQWAIIAAWSLGAGC